MMLSQPIVDSSTAATTVINENSTLGDRLGLGFQTLLQGMLTIFAILFIIYIFILILGKAMTAAKKGKKSKKSKKNEVVATEKASEPTANTGSPVSANNDEELVAVIAAAISAYTKEPATKFRVVSFKHIK